MPGEWKAAVQALAASRVVLQQLFKAPSTTAAQLQRAANAAGLTPPTPK